jgi:hypothetical protein
VGCERTTGFPARAAPWTSAHVGADSRLDRTIGAGELLTGYTAAVLLDEASDSWPPPSTGGCRRWRCTRVCTCPSAAASSGASTPPGRHSPAMMSTTKSWSNAVLRELFRCPTSSPMWRGSRRPCGPGTGTVGRQHGTGTWPVVLRLPQRSRDRRDLRWSGVPYVRDDQRSREQAEAHARSAGVRGSQIDWPEWPRSPARGHDTRLAQRGRVCRCLEALRARSWRASEVTRCRGVSGRPTGQRRDSS